MYVHACKIWYFIGNLIHLIPSIVSDGIVELIEGLQSSRAKSKSLSPSPHDHIPGHISKCLVGYHLLEKNIYIYVYMYMCMYMYTYMYMYVYVYVHV